MVVKETEKVLGKVATFTGKYMVALVGTILGMKRTKRKKR